MTLTSRQKVTSLRPIYFYFVALHISNLLKNPSLFFLLQLVWIITIHLLQQNETLQSNFPVENLDNFGVFLFLYHFDAFLLFKFSI